MRLHRGAASFNHEHDRFFHDPEYLKARLLDPAFRDGWKKINLRDEPGYPGIYPSYLWWDYFSRMAKEADARFDTIVGKYAAYLEPSELLAIQALQSNPFFAMRLKHLEVLVNANAHMPRYPVDAAFGGPDEGQEFVRFVESVTALEALLPSKGLEARDYE